MTGVSIFPSEGNLEEFFDTLNANFPFEGNLEEFFDTITANFNYPFHEPYIYAGDFNAYTTEEIKKHITLLDSHTLFRREISTLPTLLLLSPQQPLAQSQTTEGACY